ncbi:MAG: Mur ligase family protein, partial [Deltaproteobacteria bacterium]|nr:Mur ligase family protein [Deltaproteobacteria bacterium]
MMNYQEAWGFLDNLQFFKIKLGLESMSQFLDSVGNPHRGLRFVHVAGTNGKGSVSTTMRTILTKAGYKVGLYTSPHLSCVRERFRIDERFISEEAFARQASVIREALGERQITYFEFATALALLWCAEEQVDVAILEVGMGGRLDATNVITPLVSVITNVSMDHEQYLGNTLAAVAFEKAGVIKPGVPVVAGLAPDESLAVVEQVCQERKAPLFLLGREFDAVRGPKGSWEYRGLAHSHSLAGLHCRR